MTSDTQSDGELASLKALEYTVDANGCVDTTGRYRIMSQADWDSLPALPRKRNRLYAPLVAHLQAGRIVALPTRNARSAWNIARSLRRNAESVGLAVEIKRCVDPQEKGALLVLARKRES